MPHNDRNYDRPQAIDLKQGDVVLVRLRDAVSGIPHLLRVGVVTRIAAQRVYFLHPSSGQEEWTLRTKVLHVFKSVDDAEAVRRTLTTMAVEHTRRLSALNAETQDQFERLVQPLLSPESPTE